MKTIDKTDVDIYSHVYIKKDEKGRDYGLSYVVSMTHPLLKIIHLKIVKYEHS